MILRKTIILFLLILKINESNSLEAIDKTNLSEQIKFHQSEIIRIENYFCQEINQRKSHSKKLNKYITAFDCIDKILIVLSAKTGGVSIISFTSFVEALVGTASASFTLIFFSSNRNSYKNTEYNKKRKRKSVIKLLF